MNLLAIILLTAALAVIAGAYYFLLNISYAIWSPEKAKEKWVVLASSPGINWAQPIFKWVVPICTVLIGINLVLEATKFLLISSSQ